MIVTLAGAEGRFQFRSCALIIHDEKLLAVRNDDTPYWFLPGGKVQLHETAEEAVIRSIRDELGIEITLIRPLWLNQSFYTEETTGEQCHELCLYFLAAADGSDLPARGESFLGLERHRAHHFRWLPFDEVGDEYFYPLFIKDCLRDLPESLVLRTEVE